MSETCAVCKKGKGPEKCEVCGFSDNGSINRQFPIPEDTQNWLDTVVKPYRIQWEAKKREAKLLAQLKESQKKEAELTAQLEESKKNVQVSVPLSPPQQEIFPQNQPSNAEENAKQKKQKVIGIISEISILVAFFIVLFCTDKLQQQILLIIISGSISLAFGFLSLLFRRNTVIPILGLVLIYILCVVSSTIFILIWKNGSSGNDIFDFVGLSLPLPFYIAVCISKLGNDIKGVCMRIAFLLFFCFTTWYITYKVGSFIWLMLLSTVPGDIIMLVIIIMKRKNPIMSN